MEATMITIMIIGLLSSVFGLLMIFAPSIVIKAEESANQLYMTDAALMKNRIPLGIFMLLASGFLFYTYYAGPYVEIIYLYLSIIAGVFGFLLLIKPNVIFFNYRHFEESRPCCCKYGDSIGSLRVCTYYFSKV